MLSTMPFSNNTMADLVKPSLTIEKVLRSNHSRVKSKTLDILILAATLSKVGISSVVGVMQMTPTHIAIYRDSVLTTTPPRCPDVVTLCM